MPKECHKKTAIIFDTLVDTDKVDPGKYKKRKQESEVRICFVGRIVPQKGCEILLEAFVQLSAGYNNVKLSSEKKTSSKRKSQ